eukprot:5942243-Pleurochrysis_carterae.AAC.1
MFDKGSKQPVARWNPCNHVRNSSTQASRLIWEQSQDGCWEKTQDESLTVACIRVNEMLGSGKLITRFLGSSPRWLSVEAQVLTYSTR